MLQGDTPVRSDSVESIRQYFVDDGTKYLVGDFMIGIAFFIFFIPYLIALRWFLGSAEGTPAIWSWMAFAGGLLSTVLGFVSGIFWGALALGLEDNPEMDDSTIRLMMDLNAIGFAGAMIAIALS